MKVAVLILTLLCGIAASAGAELSNSSTSVLGHYSFPTVGTSTSSSVVDSLSPSTDGTKASGSLSSASVSTSSNTAATLTYATPTITPAPSLYSCDQCHLFGGSVQIFKWAEMVKGNGTNSIGSIFVNSNNYTFTSPSIYVAFQSLYATNECGAYVGPTFGSTTLVFGQNDLSTGTAWFQSTIDSAYNIPYTINANPQIQALQNPSFTQADFNDPLVCVDSTTILTWYGDDYASTSETGALPTNAAYTFNPCSPAISVPTQLFEANSAWATCLRGVNALCDPPYTLTPGGILGAFATTTSQVTVGTAEAVTAPSLPTPTPTLTPSTTPATTPAESPTPNDSSQQPTKSPPTLTNDPSNQIPASSKSPIPSTTSIIAPVVLSTPNNDPSGEPNSALPTIITLGSSTLTANSASAFVYDSQTLSPGGAITVSGILYSIPDPTTPVTHAFPSVVTVGASTITANSESLFVYGSLTLAPGALITVSGSVYSLPTAAPSYAAGPSDIIIGSQTLAPGASAITISTYVVSLDPAGSVIIDNSVTEALSYFIQAIETASSTSLGGAIMTIGGFVSSTNTPNPTSSSTSSFSGTISTGGGDRNPLRWNLFGVCLWITILGTVLC